jgi:protein TonB
MIGLERQGRIRSAIGVAMLHALLGYAFITGLHGELVRQAEEGLKLFAVREVPPPAPVAEVVPPPPKPVPQPEGSAAPAGLRAIPAAVVAPVPEVLLPVSSPIVAAPEPGAGAARSAGAAEVPGPGTGAGGSGDGTGSGGRGLGSGDGGVAIEARHLRGRIGRSDYPRVSRETQGTTFTRITVGSDGRVRDCSVMRSSGYAVLDDTTCGLIRRRFRYEPARDQRGQPVEDVKYWAQRWWRP